MSGILMKHTKLAAACLGILLGSSSSFFASNLWAGEGCPNGACPTAVSNEGCSTCEEEAKEPWTLTELFTNSCGQNWLKDHGWKITGHTQFAYFNNPDGAFVGNGILLDDREWDRFALNQQYLAIGKAAKSECGSIGWGFQADLLYGLDGNEGQAFGNNPGRYDFANGWDHGSYEWALPQLYAELAVGNLSVKAGHFYTIVGYEVLPTTGNFFASRQLTFNNSEPFTHTGVLTTYKVNDNLSLWNGWTMGWDTGFDRLNGGGNYLGGFTAKLNDDVNFIWTTTVGDLGWRGQGAVNSFILSLNWNEKISSVHQLDILGTDLGTNFAVGGVAGDSVGVINYLFYQVNDQIKLGSRQEWYNADSVAYNAITGGVNIKPMSNVIIRPEARYMWSDNELLYGASQEEIFNRTVLGVDVILTY